MLALIGTSAIAGIPLLIVSPPGTGKTTLATAALRAIYGEDRVNVQCFNGGTPPTAVRGAVDVRALTVDGVMKVTRQGTCMDERQEGIVLDELTRAPDATLNAMLEAIDALRSPERWTLPPTIVALANSGFGEAPGGQSVRGRERERYHALSDRFILQFFFTAFFSSFEQTADTAAVQVGRAVAGGYYRRIRKQRLARVVRRFCVAHSKRR
jgi:MoxR-like ATPase